MKVGGVYRIQHNIYDTYDTYTYIVKILSNKTSPAHIFYEAMVLDSGYKIYFYPEDWAIVNELSSLELELL